LLEVVRRREGERERRIPRVWLLFGFHLGSLFSSPSNWSKQVREGEWERRRGWVGGSRLSHEVSAHVDLEGEGWLE
jgi:hypothetical protein